MHGHLPRQHSCGRGAEGSDGARNVPPVARDGQCACRWHQHPPGLPHGARGHAGATQGRGRLVPLWDTVRRSPPKSPGKPQGQWWAECGCAHGWAPPVQVSCFFSVQAT